MLGAYYPRLMPVSEPRRLYFLFGRKPSETRRHVQTAIEKIPTASAKPIAHATEKATARKAAIANVNAKLSLTCGRYVEAIRLP